MFEILHKRIKNDLQSGKNVVYDATNLNRKRRVAFLNELKNVSCKKICTLVATPWECCLAQNFARERYVPDEVMCRMYKNFQMPSVYESFDEVIVHYEKKEWKTFYGDSSIYINDLCDFNQENSHHVLTLGDHLKKSGNYMLAQNTGKWDDVVYAAFTHDIGKPDVKSFYNSNGEIDYEAHYYSHQNVGAYKSLFYTYPDEANKKYIALLIELHMRPYMEWKQSEKAKQKDLNMFGQEVIDDVMLLHAADMFAH